MIVLGIDPGLATMGFGVIDTDGHRNKLIEYGALITTPDQPQPERLLRLSDGIDALIGKHRPAEIAFEELFFARNVTTAMSVGAARGVAIVACRKRVSDIYEYTPMQVKQAITGYGKAAKHQIQWMVRVLLNMKEIPKPDDAADALAVALTHAQCTGMKEQFRIK